MLELNGKVFQGLIIPTQTPSPGLAYLQVLEGALAGLQAKLSGVEDRNSSLEQQVEDFDLSRGAFETEKQEFLLQHQQHQTEVAGLDKQIKALEAHMASMTPASQEQDTLSSVRAPKAIDGAELSAKLVAMQVSQQAVDIFECIIKMSLTLKSYLSTVPHSMHVQLKAAFN